MVHYLTPATRWCVVALACWAGLAAGAHAAQPDAGYTLGPRDVLRITVFNEEELSGAYTVEADGMVSFPLIGWVGADGLTMRQFEEDLKVRLADGYLRDPRLVVTIAEYRSRRIFIVGEVRQPGAYPLTGDMSLIEALALAGSTTRLAAGEVTIVRAGEASEAVLPDERRSAETIRVELAALQTGAASVALRDGDTVFVPLAETAYVFGEVRNPGAYPIQSGTTVLQVLSLAGGTTEFGALNRVRIARMVDGEQVEIRVELTDIVRPDDTVIVPQRFF